MPDPSTFSKNRHGRFRESDLLYRLFGTVLARCIAEGLVGGEGFAVDASLIKVDANQPSPTTLAPTPTPARPASSCATSEGLQLTAPARRRRRDAALLREQARLRGLLAEATILPNASARESPRSIHEGARQMARDICASEAGRTSRRERKKVEMLFARLKRILRLNRLRFREPDGTLDEFHRAAAAQNLRKLAKLIPLGQPSLA